MAILIKLGYSSLLKVGIFSQDWGLKFLHRLKIKILYAYPKLRYIKNWHLPVVYIEPLKMMFLSLSISTAKIMLPLLISVPCCHHVYLSVFSLPFFWFLPLLQRFFPLAQNSWVFMDITRQLAQSFPSDQRVMSYDLLSLSPFIFITAFCSSLVHLCCFNSTWG